MSNDTTNTDLPANLGFNQAVEDFLKSNFSFKYNVITCKTEGKMLNSEVYNELNDFEMNSLHRLLSINNINCSISKLRNLLCSNFVTQYNPVKDYLNSLPQYDGSQDHISDLAGTVETTNPELWKKYLMKWIVAWAASLADENIINHTVLVLNGGQGPGKSTWLSKLVPKVLNKYVYAGTINPDNKDTLVYLSECVLINLDEFDNMNRTQLGGTKELITKEKVKIRRPYGHSSENLPRRASFVASVNQQEFLSDVTGNRRFLCFETSKIDYQHEIDMDLVFGQALYLYKSGFRFWLDMADIEEINRSNEKFCSMSIEEEALLTYYEVCELDDNASFMTNTEILVSLGRDMKLPINQGAKKRLGAALAKYKFCRVKRKGRAVYAVKEKHAYPTACLYKDLIKSEDAA